MFVIFQGRILSRSFIELKNKNEFNQRVEFGCVVGICTLAAFTARAPRTSNAQRNFHIQSRILFLIMTIAQNVYRVLCKLTVIFGVSPNFRYY